MRQEKNAINQIENGYEGETTDMGSTSASTPWLSKLQEPRVRRQNPPM
jgi:hypothetical protein